MAKKKQKRAKRHRLLVYFRVGQRLRMKPLLIALLSVVLLVISYPPFTSIGVPWLGPFQRPFPSIFVPWLGPLQRPLIIGLIVASGGLYFLSILISRVSLVQARRDYLYVRAGIVPVAISYTRIRSLRSVQVSQQYSPKSLKASERALMEPFFKLNALALDLRSFPKGEKSLRRLWSKFMFASDLKGLLLVVNDSQLLKAEITELRQHYLDRMEGYDAESGDIFDRVAHRHRGS